MKSLLLAIMLVSSLAQAQYLVPGNGDGHGRPGRPGGQPAPYPGDSGQNGGGHHGGGYNPNPYDPNPYDPYPSYPSQPSYDDYGPARTYRWLDMGTTKIDKFVTETIRIRANDRLVNEVILRSTSGDTQVTRAYARLSNGRTTNVTTGLIRNGREARVRLDYQYSVRVDEIIIEATSQNLVGSRARLQVILGLAE